MEYVEYFEFYTNNNHTKYTKNNTNHTNKNKIIRISFDQPSPLAKHTPSSTHTHVLTNKQHIYIPFVPSVIFPTVTVTVTATVKITVLIAQILRWRVSVAFCLYFSFPIYGLHRCLAYDRVEYWGIYVINKGVIGDL